MTQLETIPFFLCEKHRYFSTDLWPYLCDNDKNFDERQSCCQGWCVIIDDIGDDTLVCT